MTESKPILMHLFADKIKIVDAIAFRRSNLEDNKGRWVKQPKVHLKYENKDLYIVDKHIMHNFLNILLLERMKYHDYLQLVDEFPLEVMLQEALLEARGGIVKCWVTDNNIEGFSETHIINNEAIGFTLTELSVYLASKGYKVRHAMEDYDFGEGKTTSFTSTFINKGKVISIVAHDRNPIIQSRYINNTVMLISSRVFKGFLSTIEAGELYESIDEFLEELEHIEYLVSHAPDYELVLKNQLCGTEYIRKFRDKNKIEKENYSTFRYYFS